MNILSEIFAGLEWQRSNRLISSNSDVFSDEEEDFLKSWLAVIGYVNLATIPFSLAGVGGAFLYNVILVGASAAGQVLGYIAGIYLTIRLSNGFQEKFGTPFTDAGTGLIAHVLGGLFTLLFIYPHVGFIMEVNSGTMSKETYHREEASCCCA